MSRASIQDMSAVYVEGIITAADFIELTKGAQLLFV